MNLPCLTLVLPGDTSDSRNSSLRKNHPRGGAKFRGIRPEMYIEDLL